MSLPQNRPQNQYATVDFYNSTDQDILAESTYESTTEIIPSAQDYFVTVESGTVDLSSMVLNPDPNFKILIFNNDKTGKYPNLPEINNFFSFNEHVRNVEDVLLWLSNITHEKALPADLGHFDVDSEGYFTFSPSGDSAISSGDIVVFFNTRLKEILPQFLDNTNITVNGDLYYLFNMDGASGTTVKQSRYTLSRLMTATLVRFYTDLPITPHLVFGSVLGTATRENILTTITLNNETFDVLNKYNAVYTPQNFHLVTMTNGQPIEKFRVWIKIYYKGGRYVFHTLKPGDYLLINVAFLPRGEIM